MLRLAWSRFLEESERIKFQALQRHLSGLNYFRVVTDKMTAAWTNLEITLSTKILRALINSDHPERLDEIFWIDDHRAQLAAANRPESKSLENGGAQAHAEEASGGRERYLISRFAASAESRIKGSDFDVAKLRRLLHDFLSAAPLATLQTPNRIHDALQNWFQDEYERGVGKRRRATNRKWLLEFLSALRDQNATGPLPDFRTRLKFSLRKALQTLGEPKTILPIAGVIALAALMVVGWLFGDIAGPKDLGPSLVHVDNLLLGGLVARGNVIAGCVALPIVIHIIASLRGQKWNLLLATPIATGIQLLLALWIANWVSDGFTVMDVLRFVGVFLLVFFAIGFAKNIVWMVHMDTGLDITAAWLC